MSKLFFGGVPTEPDVKKLIDAYGVPQPGMIPYADVAAVIGLDPKSTRWRSVTDAWRFRLRRENNIEVRAIPGMGFKVLTEQERIPDTYVALRQTARVAREANRRAVSIDSARLNDVDRTKRDHLCRATAMVATSTSTEVGSIAAALKPPPQMPRPQGDA